MELFDYLKSIGAHIDFNGSYGPNNTFVNVKIKKDGSDCFINGSQPSFFGRSETPDFDEAVQDLANQIRGKKIAFVIGGGERHNLPVPKNLKHTKGYEPK